MFAFFYMNIYKKRFPFIYGGRFYFSPEELNKSYFKDFLGFNATFFLNQKRMFHVKHLLCNKKKIETIQRKKSHITVRLFARGLDKEMGMSGTDAFAPSEK